MNGGNSKATGRKKGEKILNLRSSPGRRCEATRVGCQTERTQFDLVFKRFIKKRTHLNDIPGRSGRHFRRCGLLLGRFDRVLGQSSAGFMGRGADQPCLAMAGILRLRGLSNRSGAFSLLFIGFQKADGGSVGTVAENINRHIENKYNCVFFNCVIGSALADCDRRAGRQCRLGVMPDICEEHRYGNATGPHHIGFSISRESE